MFSEFPTFFGFILIKSQRGLAGILKHVAGVKTSHGHMVSGTGPTASREDATCSQQTYKPAAHHLTLLQPEPVRPFLRLFFYSSFPFNPSLLFQVRTEDTPGKGLSGFGLVSLFCLL